MIRFLVLIFFALCASVLAEEKKNTKYKFSFGVIADCQYCVAPDRGQRKYSASKEKLHQCVEHFNKEDLSFVIHLGDFIDRDFSSFDEILPIYNSLECSRLSCSWKS